MKTETLLFKRTLVSPFIRPKTGTVAPDAVTTPDILVQDNEMDLYIGAVDGDRERMIHIPFSGEELKTSQSLYVPAEASLILDAGPNDFDCEHVFDPAVIKWKNRFMLYYSAMGKGEDAIGVAFSSDGKSFTKNETALLIGRSPEVVINNENLFLFYVLNHGGRGYSIFVANSDDGINFESCGRNPILEPGVSGDWDDMEVTTPRIFSLEDNYYMIYAGINENDEKDIPRAFGLARSKDLIVWEKYPHNPVFKTGEDGTWDDGALWFGTPFSIGDEIYLIYEGGRIINIRGKIPALTQVGLARVSKEAFLEKMMLWQ